MVAWNAVSNAATWGTSDRKSTRLNSSHDQISYAVFCLKKKKLPPSLRSIVTRRAASCKQGGSCRIRGGNCKQVCGGWRPGERCRANTDVFFFLKSGRPPASNLFPPTALLLF